MDIAQLKPDSPHRSSPALPEVASAGQIPAAQHWADYARIGLVAMSLAVSRTHLVPEIDGIDIAS